MFTYSSQKISKDFMLKVDGVIRVLGLTEYEYCLGDKDYDFALELLNRDGIIDVMSILQVGDTVEILDPPLKLIKVLFYSWIAASSELMLSFRFLEWFFAVGLLVKFYIRRNNLMYF